MLIAKLSDFRTINGLRNIDTDTVLIPKAYYKTMLKEYPETLKQVDAFFTAHKTVKAVVIKGLDEE